MKVLVANRGEIACRILKTLREMGIPSVAVYTDPDRRSPHPDLADEAVPLGAAEQYLSTPSLLAAAKKSGATALHPGYGFLSQSPAFARACAEAGLMFIGPGPEAMEALGDKKASRALAQKLGVPVIPGAEAVDTLPQLREAAARLGYPVLVKAAGGGGGKGMKRANSEGDLQEAYESARREAKRAFGDDRLLLEKYIQSARHIEVQILGNGREVVALGERDCSLQRRFQKVIEEGPAPQLPEPIRQALMESAVKIGRAAGYRSAGTVEFLVEPGGSFYFLEVNTRLQVEHPVTEMITGLDLVRAQIEIASGGSLPAPPVPRGHAIEARLNAEDPYREFIPQMGRILMAEWPHSPGVRVDHGLREGQEIGSHYDSLLAKIIAWGADREQARCRLRDALRRETVVLGVTTNLPFLLQLIESDVFKKGAPSTTTLESLSWPEPALPAEVAAIAQQLLAGSASRSGGGGENDPYSPWKGPGSYRVGS